MAKFKKFYKKVSFKFIEYIFLVASWIVYFTCKKKFSNTNLPKDPCVILFWHGRLSMMSFAYLHWWKKKFKNRHGKVIISNHKDGEIIANIVLHFGIKSIRGSSSKGGVKALLQAFKEIENGFDVIITPDGPRGPNHSIADGAVIIAQKKDLEICILNYEASKFWQFKSWDEMIFPKPFSQINYSLSKPFKVTNLNLESAKNRIKSEFEKSLKQDKIFN